MIPANRLCRTSGGDSPDIAIGDWAHFPEDPTQVYRVAEKLCGGGWAVAMFDEETGEEILCNCDRDQLVVLPRRQPDQTCLD